VPEEKPPVYSGAAVERRRWTDERLDDLATEMRRGFDQVDRDLRELRQWMLRMTLGMTVGFLSVLAAILARGA
jgi:hypothetical protein